MKSYWLWWVLLTIFKAGMLFVAILGAIGGIVNPSQFLLLAITCVPLSIWFLYDFVYQVLVPIQGGVGNRLHKPSDTPMYMGLAPSWREAKEEIRMGHCIIWG